MVGSDGRFVLEEACQHLRYYPRRSMETETYDFLGGMMAFSETFKSRISTWIEQNLAAVPAEAIDASGQDALKVQTIIEAIIESWESGQVVTL